MKKSTKPTRSERNDSIFVQLMVSTSMSYILLGVGAFFVFFLSPEGDPLNKGENGNGSWNLWVGVLIWGVMVVLYFFKDKSTFADFFKDTGLRNIDREIQDTMDSQVPYLLKIKRERPEDWARMVKSGLVSEDLKGDDDDSNEDAKRDSQKPEDHES